MTTTKHNLSLDDWQRYQSGAAGNAGHGFEKTISGDDMNYLAAKGFEKTNMGPADVSELMKRIDAKTFSAVNLNAIFIGGIIVVVFTSLFFFITKSDRTTPAEIKSPQTTASPNKTSNIFIAPAVMSDTGQKAGEKKPGQWHKEHFASLNLEQPYQENKTDAENPIDKSEVVDMNINRINALPMEDNTTVNFDQLPNAPVIDIMGYKITNFNKYYLRGNQKFELVNGGLGAQYDDAISYKAYRKELKEGDKTTADQLLREAIEYFHTKKYAACIADFDLLLKINRDDVNAFFYSGMSFYLTQKNVKAVEFFDKVLASENNIFHQEAEFYKASALLAMGETADAKIVLKKIADDKGFYAQRAAELLKGK